METRRKWCSGFQVLKIIIIKTQARIIFSVKTTFSNKKSRHSQIKKKTKRIYCQQIYSKRMPEESSLNRKEMLEEGNLEIQERNKNMINKNTGKILFSFFL